MSEAAQNSDQTMAGSAARSENIPPPPPVQPREVFPVTMEKDYKDFRGIVDKDFSGTRDSEESDPKVSSAPASASTPESVTGLEDVSEEDLATIAQQSAARGRTHSNTEATSAG